LRYIIDITPELGEEVELCIRSGKYRNVQDFVTAALRNQVYLESPTAVSSGLSQEDRTIATRSVGNTPDMTALRSDISQAKTVALTASSRPDFIWGQYNKLFPVKIVTRVAANLAINRATDFIALTELQDEAADLAREVGKIIEQNDKQSGRKRGNIFSAGLPIGKRVEKAKTRFKTQFVGYLSRERMEGAAPALKFLELKKGSSGLAYAGLTNLGLKFAAIRNPILDAGEFDAPFSTEEVNFLLDHISANLPQEAELMRYILSEVAEGIATPEELNRGLDERLHDWKHNEVVTMRAGLVSRLSELGLLTRKKDGVKVTYFVTELGQKFLNMGARREVAS
jgi:hypothetical protein